MPVLYPKAPPRSLQALACVGSGVLDDDLDDIHDWLLAGCTALEDLGDEWFGTDANHAPTLEEVVEGFSMVEPKFIRLLGETKDRVLYATPEELHLTPQIATWALTAQARAAFGGAKEDAELAAGGMVKEANE